jgi:dTDP-4-dehydrorhamnose reductase
MRVLITGSRGQVGHCLTEQLRNYTDAQFLVLDSKGLDITDQSAVQAAVNCFKPTIIINAAAYTAVDRAEDEVDLAYAINRDGPKFLAEAAQSVNAAILHISTDYVFSGEKIGLYEEFDIPAPQNIYGESKLAGEQAIIKACDKHIILRTAWVFGEAGNNFVKTMLRLGKEHKALSIVGDQFGGPTYAGDIASVLVTIAKTLSNGDNDKYGIYHYSGFPHISWFEFAQEIFKNAKEQNILDNIPTLTAITTAEYPTPAKRPANSTLATNKITDIFAIEASDWKLAISNLEPYTK